MSPDDGRKAEDSEEVSTAGEGLAWLGLGSNGESRGP